MVPRPPRPDRPTRADLEAARGRTLRDVIAKDLDVLLVGINPSLYSAATGHHFARPGNRFWRALHDGGWTDRLLDPAEDRDLPRYGLGVTNLVARATASADELTPTELERGAKTLERKVERNAPRAVAFLGVVAYRAAFRRPRATRGEQPDRIAGARVFVLPNPSGLNANDRPADFARLFRQLREAVRSH